MTDPDPASGGRPSREEAALRALCRLCGVRTSHEDGFRRRVRPPRETLAAVLGALGVPIEDPGDAPDALESVRVRGERRLVPEISVLWGDAPPVLAGGPALDPGAPVEVRVELEDGTRREWSVHPGPGRRVRLPEPLPDGYHRVTLRQDGAGGSTSGAVVAAPARAFAPPGPDDPPRWGIFLPLYALRTADDWGTGDLSDLARLLDWTRARGGDVVGTLPLLAAFLDDPFEPSPYAPASRLFWNELYLDPLRTPEWEASPEARNRIGDPEVAERLRRLRAADRVDYAEAWEVKRGVLEALTRTWLAAAGPDDPGFRRFVAEHPEVERYAAFRALREARGEPWAQWPEEWRTRGIPEDRVPSAPAYRHLYAQYRTAEQMAEATGTAGPGGEEGGLYLDLPLGTHGEGYDVWARPGLFAAGMSGGAPPDGFFEEGQDWGFPVLRPDALRTSGHHYFAACLRHLLRPASMLRIDHVMSLHRLYWVPRGASAKEGAYVRYPAELLYAVLCLESHRARAAVVGEDLGTVPPGVREAMDRRGVRRMYVAPFEIDREQLGGLAPVPRGSVAAVGTHDTPPFAAFWRGRDIEERAERQEATPDEARERAEEEREERRAARRLLGLGPRPAEAHRGLLERLGRSPAGLVLVNLEDLWEEERPQNVPGTPASENWRGRSRHPLEAFDDLPEVAEPLAALDRARKDAPTKASGRAQPMGDHA